MSSSERHIEFGRAPIGHDDIVAVARRGARISLSEDPEFRDAIAASRAALEAMVADGATVYGVTTGFGENCVVDVDSERAQELAQNLVRFHGCGTGDFLSAEQSIAVLAVRLKSLCRGESAVRWEVLETLATLINERVAPAIPERGSVGASGDLTPLSYVAAVLNGQRRVWWRDQLRPTGEVFDELGIEPVKLRAKESLALMNGTSVMTALGALAMARAEALVRMSACITAALCDVCRGNAAHFDERIFRAKPHPGQAEVARLIRERLDYDPSTHEMPERVQDRYSIRCAPHVTGVLADGLRSLGEWVDTEINSANDNPLIDASTQTALHGGGFYGGHIAFAMDSLKSAVASVTDLLDRQMQLVCEPDISGLPTNLVDTSGANPTTNHGFKAMMIGTSAIAAEALKLTMPAASFSRSTESHNQDKVSMGTISARDMHQILDLSEEACAMMLIACAQAAELRGVSECTEATRQLHGLIRRDVEFADRDRPFDRDIRVVVERIRGGLAETLCPQGALS